MVPQPDVRLKETDLAAEFIDTVKPVNGWRKDPFKPTLESNGKLYGLGSNDAGASVVSSLQVFLTLCRTTQAYNLIYLAVRRKYQARGNRMRIAGTPSHTVCHCRRADRDATCHCRKRIDGAGIGIIVTGKSGHAARNEGDNAIYKVLDDIALVS